MSSKIIGCGALFYTLDTQRFLLLHRVQSKQNHVWGLVGGTTVNENLWEGLNREIKEEIGEVDIKKKKPNNIKYGCGIEIIDFEGRIIRADYDGFSVMSVYFPSGSSGDIRQKFKFKFLKLFEDYVESLKKTIPNLIICGDYNICHKSIDIHNPTRNKNTSGFLPEEREWLDKFINNGFVDTFRYFNSSPHKYSWWSYRANSRANNKGWRIDYLLASVDLQSNLKESFILPDVYHSDHCPIGLKIKI